MDIRLIYAMSLNNVIGNRGKLPWHIPEDLEWFKAMTERGVVVMGRKTWESLPEKVKPLPNRINVVISKTLCESIAPDNTFYYPTLDAAFEKIYAVPSPIWLIGGKGIIEEGMQYATSIVLTRVLYEAIGDVFVEDIDESVWVQSQRSPTLTSGEFQYQHECWVRKESIHIPMQEERLITDSEVRYVPRP